MKLVGSLPVLAILTALSLSSSVALAQTPALASPVYLDLDRPVASFSSSSANDFMLAAPAARSAAAPAAAMPAQQVSHMPFSGIAAGVKFGLGGVGFDVATPLVPGRLNLRGGASFFSYNPNITVDNILINGAIKFQNADVMADFFPFHGRFRISGGATVYNFTNLAATLSVPAGQSFTLGGTTYYSQTGNPITGNGVFNFGGKSAGRVSIGTGNMLPRKGRFTFESEIGVQFFSSPTVVYNFSGGGCTGQTTTGSVTVQTNCGPIPQSSIASEQNELQNDLTDLKYYPVLSIGVSYKIH